VAISIKLAIASQIKAKHGRERIFSLSRKESRIPFSRSLTRDGSWATAGRYVVSDGNPASKSANGGKTFSSLTRACIGTGPNKSNTKASAASNQKKDSFRF